MKFEEQFPGLKDKVMDYKGAKILNSKIVQIYCLDKQKVLEVIDKGISKSEVLRVSAIKEKDSLLATSHRAANLVLIQLKKELGLE